MRVLTLSHMFPTPELPAQGIFVLGQMKALRKLGVEMQVIAPTPWAPRVFSGFGNVARYRRVPIKANIEGLDVRYPRFPALPGGRLFYLYGFLIYLACRETLKLCGRQAPIDLIHAHTILPDGLAAILLGRKFGIPVVCTAHGSDISIYPYESVLTLWLTKWSLRRTKHLMTVSQDLKRKIELLAGPKDVPVIRNGADAELFARYDKMSARECLGLPRDRKIVLFVGNLFTVKGPEYLIDAVAGLDRADVDLYLVGEGPLRSELAGRADRGGLAERCVFVGSRPHSEIGVWLSAADCLAVPSLSEGFPTVIAEAVMCNTPVVATAVGGVPEFIQHRQTGYLVPPRDRTALAEAIASILNGGPDIREMVRRAEEQGRTELTWDANARRTADVYREAMAAGAHQKVGAVRRRANVGYTGKRVLDLLIAIPAFLVALPLMLLVAALVAIFLGTPVIFRQKRPGRHGAIFTIFKFRTMTEKRTADGELLPDDMRLTAFGRLLRNLSIDELPELVNVLRGEMSIVGPRPLMVRYLPRYSATQMRRHEVNPGITGWAQVNGRNAVSWDGRLSMDVWYVDHQSFLLDIKILLLTIRTLVSRHGINEPGEIGSSEFLGAEANATSRS